PLFPELAAREVGGPARRSAFSMSVMVFAFHVLKQRTPLAACSRVDAVGLSFRAGNAAKASVGLGPYAKAVAVYAARILNGEAPTNLLIQVMTFGGLAQIWVLMACQQLVTHLTRIHLSRLLVSV